ncbi:MAG: enoyl-CoA hydratase/isomerase family protein [Pseudomonadota bacterium]
MPGTIHVATERHVATVTLDSPGKLNAIGVAMWLELRRAFESFATAPVRCVVVRGAGGNFAAGADIEEFREVRHDEASGRRFHLELLAPALEAIRAAPQPVIAAIEGVCVGGGLEIALACDVRIAADGARFGAPVGRLGFPFALPELRPLLELVGPGVAAELLLTGRLYDAQEALAKGLIQRVVTADGLAAAVEETVGGVLAGSPLAARLNKSQIRLLLARGMQYTQHDLDSSFGFFGSNDYKEGVSAFLDKRPPRFTGT